MTNKLTITQRRWLLSAHILFSVIWLGAVLCTFVLFIVATDTNNGDVPQSIQESIDILDETIILPLAVGALVTGILLSVLTKWGLFKFWWLIVKEILTLLPIALGVFVQVVRPPEEVIWFTSLTTVACLSAAVVISVFKRWGQRNQQRERGRQHAKQQTVDGVSQA